MLYSPNVLFETIVSNKVKKKLKLFHQAVDNGGRFCFIVAIGIQDSKSLDRIVEE